MLPRDGVVVVVGASIAGVTAAEELRAVGFDGEIVLLDSQPGAPYARPPLSKAVLSGKDTPESTHLAPVDEQGVVLLDGVEALGLDVDDSVVVAAGGRRIPFDGLVIASGSRARTVADLGGNTTGIPEQVLRTMADAIEIRRRLVTASSLVVVGAGVLGMELASVATSLGVRTTVLSNEPPLLTQCGPFISDLVSRSAASHGVSVMVDSRGVVLNDHGGRLVAELGGIEYDADLLVSAVGDLPNVEWLDGSGIDHARGVVVDSRCRVSSRIVAAGDVAAFGSPPRRSPHWSSAIDQARVAARALVLGDGAEPLVRRPYFWTDQFDLALKMTGHAPFAGTPEVLAGSLPDLDAVVQWTSDTGPSGALAINRRVGISQLHVAAGNPLAPTR